jgi:hypothetical protein
MKLQITEKWRELWLDVFKQALPFFEKAKEDRDTLEDIRKNIHSYFKSEINYIKENWIFDEDWIEYTDMTDKQIEKFVESVKFLCLHLVAIKEKEWYTKTQDVLDFLYERIDLFSSPFNK